MLTYPNADNGGRDLIPMIEDYAASNPGRVLAIPSLGFRRYLSVVGKAAAVVGNSSSGLIEVPSFGVPTVNIGARQQGRLCAESVVHCLPEKACIVAALETALSEPFSAACKQVENPYGQGDAAKQIVQILETCDVTGHKSFHDLS